MVSHNEGNILICIHNVSALTFDNRFLSSMEINTKGRPLYSKPQLSPSQTHPLTPTSSVHIISLAYREHLLRLTFDVCVVSYEMITKERAAFRKIKWKFLCIDEAHRIKDEKSLLSQVVRELHTMNRMLITGTLIIFPSLTYTIQSLAQSTAWH